MIDKIPLDKRALLEHLNGMNYSERAKTMALLGRDYSDNEEFKRLLTDLISIESTITSKNNYDEYKGNLALTAARAGKNIDIILKGLEHNSARIRYKAASILGEIGNVQDIEKVIKNISCECRRRIIKKIAVCNRINVAEKILPLIHEKYGDKEAVTLLNGCSYETVKKYLNEIGYAVVNWKVLASRNTNAVEEYFEDQLNNSNDNQRIYVWNRFSSALEQITFKNPEFILDCITKYGPANVIFTLFKDKCGVLLRKNPLKVYDILMNEKSRQYLLNSGVPKGILKNKDYLTNEQWINIGTLLKDKTFKLIDILRALCESRTKDVFEGIFKEDERKNAVLPLDLLYVLPSNIRDKEAERMLKIREIYENKHRKIMVTACRDIEYSRNLLESGVKSSDSETRALYYGVLVRSTSFSRKGMAKTIQFLKRVKNDQDLVKREIFQRLSKSSPSLFKEVNINDLAELFNCAIEARDSSYDTLSYALKVAYNLMKYSEQCTEASHLFDFSLDIILKILGKDPHLRLPSFKYHTPKGLEEKIFDKIYPYALNGKNRGDYNFIINVADAFGRRGNNIIRLQELLKAAVLNGSESISKNALKYYLSSKKTRDIRVRELLKIDKSFIAVDSVFEHVHRKRQELLGPFVTWNKIKGKFITGDTTYLVPAYKDFYRWHPDSQKKFTEILEAVATNPKYEVYMRVNAIKSLGQMTIKDSEKIILTLLDNEDMNVSEAAIYALSTIDNPKRGALYLLNYLNDDRARTAMYSLRKCLSRMKASDAESILADLLNRDKLKITVKKEIIRLIGEYRFGRTLNILKENFENPSIHKDIKIAIGHAVKNFLEDDESWDILNMTASSQVPDIAISVLNQSPLMIPEKHREKYLRIILKTTHHKDSYVAGMGFISLRNWANVNEKSIGEACAEAIKDMDNCSTWRKAMDTLVYICTGGRIDDIVLDIFKDLSQAAYKCEENYSSSISNLMDNSKLECEEEIMTERDMPARQRCMELSNKILSLQFTARMKLKDKLFKDVISILSINQLQNQSMAYLKSRFYIGSIDWRSESHIICQLKNIEQIIKMRPFIIMDVCRSICANIDNSRGFVNMDILLEVSEKFSHDTFELQFIGLALLETCGSKLNWNKKSAAVLNRYRNSLNDEIKYRAFDIWTVCE